MRRTGENTVRWMVPDLQGSARNFLCGQVNIIGYAYRVSKDGKVSFRMAFDRPGTVAADRYNLLPRVMPNPSYSKIMEYYTRRTNSMAVATIKGRKLQIAWDEELGFELYRRADTCLR